jgi:hypothetical protein
MKKTFFWAALCLMNVALTAQEDYELRTLTFEDTDYRGTAANAATYWSDLIPATAYGNGNGHNAWSDEGNTFLSYTPSPTALFPGYGGHALSNYVGNDLSQGYYMNDLQAYHVQGGANNSSNFCVHFGYLDDSGMGMMSELVYFAFADGIERTIDHMYVTNTTYAYSLLENGDGWMIPGGGVTDECWFKIIAYGYNAANQLTNTAEFMLWDQDWEHAFMKPHLFDEDGNEVDEDYTIILDTPYISLRKNNTYYWTIFSDQKNKPVASSALDYFVLDTSTLG